MRKIIQKLFKKTYSKKERITFKFLRTNVLFHELSDRQLEKVFELSYKRSYKKNEVVFFQNDPSQALYIVLEGAVRMYIDHEQSQETLLEIDEGYVFGQNSIMPNTRRFYNAIVIADQTELYVIPQQRLFELFKHDKELKSSLLQTLVMYYNGYIEKIFTNYRENFGFFELSMIYKKK